MCFLFDNDGTRLLGPAILKTRVGAGEVVTSLLLNFIILIFEQMVLEGPLKDPVSMGWPQSERFWTAPHCRA